MYLSIVAVC